MDLFLSFGMTNGATKKERNEMGLSLNWPPLAKATQQPTKNSTSIGAIIRDTFLPQQNVWGGQLPIILDGNLSNKK